MTARRLAVLVRHLPADALSVQLASQEQEPTRSAGRSAQGPRLLEDIPVVPLREARSFIQSSGDEFVQRFAQDQAS